MMNFSLPILLLCLHLWQEGVGSKAPRGSFSVEPIEKGACLSLRKTLDFKVWFHSKKRLESKYIGNFQKKKEQFCSNVIKKTTWAFT